MRWTTGQNDVIRELGHLGVVAVHDAIVERFGVEHTIHAIEMQASRIHAPLKVQQVCPDCGVVGLRLNRQTGLCPRCTERLHLEEATAFNDLLIEERMEAEGSMTDEIGAALAQAGYDRDKTFRRMREEKLIRTGAKGLTMQKRMSDGSRPHCYCIDGPATVQLAWVVAEWVIWAYVD